MKTDAEKKNDYKLTLDEISSSYMEPRHKIGTKCIKLTMIELEIRTFQTII